MSLLLGDSSDGNNDELLFGDTSSNTGTNNGGLLFGNENSDEQGGGLLFENENSNSPDGGLLLDDSNDEGILLNDNNGNGGGGLLFDNDNQPINTDNGLLFGDGGRSNTGGIPFVSVAEPEPEGEPEGYPELEQFTVTVDKCKREWNPWAEPEPEGEPEGVYRPYAEPPAPMLQPSGYRERGTYSTLAAVVATLIIVLNIVVLVVLSRKPKQRKSLSCLIGLIAAFDIVGGLQFLWFSSFDVQLMFTHADMWIIVMCGIWMLTMAPQISAMMHFGLHLLDELQVGVNNAKISSGRIIFIVLTVFVLPVGLFIPPLAGWNCIGCRSPLDDYYYCARKCSMAIFPFTKIYVLLMVVLLFAAMVIVISIYTTIYVTMCQKKCERRLSPKSGKADVVKTTMLLLVAYILCVLPVSIVMVFDYVNYKCDPHIINAFHGTLFVSFLSNLANPIIVFTCLPSMRNTKKQVKVEDNGSLKRISSSSTEENGINGAFTVDEKPPLDDETPDTKV
uniref:rhodopsin-like n=1 Tax=Styela clava TaxID=7725 RepID=UPI0019398A4E|nr:rhodopsin-like [Styela clava]